jgi:hypothetical protein
MTDAADSKSTEWRPFAWQPLTPRGVAAFARAPLMRLVLVQFIFALVAAVAVVWFLRTAWFPTVREAIENLPEQGEMKSGKLEWKGDSPQLLGEAHFLAFVVDTNHAGLLRSPAQVQVEFGRDDIHFYSLAGYVEWPYPPEWNTGVDRATMKPKWGAWEPPIQWLAFGGTLAWCLLNWWVLATIYVFPVWLGAFFGNRDLKFFQCWKLAGAGLMPGALLMILVIVAYGFGILDLVQLAAGVVMHFLVGWAYVFWGTWVTPRISESNAATKNPFTTAPEKPVKVKSPENPFAATVKDEPQRPTSNNQPPVWGNIEHRTLNAERRRKTGKCR